MSTLEEQLRHAMKDVCLSDTERASLRGKLLSEMTQTSLSVTSRRLYSRALTRNRLKKTMPIALLIALLMSGSVSYAAEGSAPGDVLYPIKIHVNENVRGALAVSDIAKAKLEVDLADRRLKEAEQLESEQRLDATTSLELSARYAQHRSFADEHVKAVKKSNKKEAEQISLDLDLRIKSHHDILGLLGIEDDDTQDGEQAGSGEASTTAGEHSGDIHASTTRFSETEMSDKEDGSDKKSSDKKTPVPELNVNVSPHAERTSNDDSKETENDSESKNSDDTGGGIHIPLVTPSALISPTPTLATPASMSVNGKVFTFVEVALHNNGTSCYSAISGSVYDLTSFIGNHPGGSVILSICGKDGTEAFTAQHGGGGLQASILASLKIGVLK